MSMPRRALLRRVAIGLPMVSALLAACSTPTAVAPTSPPTTGVPPTVAPTTAPAAAKPTTAPTTAAAAPTAAPSATAAASAAKPTTAAAASTKPKAIIGIIQEPTSLDPTADATASIATTLRDNLYEGLVRLDASGKIVGALANAWDVSPDGTSITFHLVSGAKWHDGTPLSAQDVKCAYDRAANGNTQPH